MAVVPRRGGNVGPSENAQKLKQHLLHFSKVGFVFEKPIPDPFCVERCQETFSKFR
jgi:hypothetical protein